VSSGCQRWPRRALHPDKLERLGRYEVDLDRKLETMLTMLLRLKDLRQSAGRSVWKKWLGLGRYIPSEAL
jgi:hypothetical protein